MESKVNVARIAGVIASLHEKDGSYKSAYWMLQGLKKHEINYHEIMRSKVTPCNLAYSMALYALSAGKEDEALELLESE